MVTFLYKVLSDCLHITPSPDHDRRPIAIKKKRMLEFIFSIRLVIYGHL